MGLLDILGQMGDIESVGKQFADFMKTSKENQEKIIRQNNEILELLRLQTGIEPKENENV